ncbi:MAG: hypothetical protein V1807_01385 [Patescibacteria group bacterium]
MSISNFKSTSTRDPKVISALKLAQKKLNKFFGIKLELPPVVLLQSRREIDKFWGKKTESWLCAWTKSETIYILDPKVFAKESDHTAGQFWQVLVHEYVHLYYHIITDSNTGKPRWLNEGLACYLAGQNKTIPAEGDLISLNGFFNVGGQKVYGVGYYWVKYLLDKYPQNKLLQLIRTVDSHTTARQFAYNFQDIYGFALTKSSLRHLAGKHSNNLK